jgi:hypothetical protein
VLRPADSWRDANPAEAEVSGARRLLRMKRIRRSDRARHSHLRHPSTPARARVVVVAVCPRLPTKNHALMRSGLRCFEDHRSGEMRPWDAKVHRLTAET